MPRKCSKMCRETFATLKREEKNKTLKLHYILQGIFWQLIRLTHQAIVYVQKLAVKKKRVE